MNHLSRASVPIASALFAALVVLCGCVPCALFRRGVRRVTLPVAQQTRQSTAPLGEMTWTCTPTGPVPERTAESPRATGGQTAPPTASQYPPDSAGHVDGLLEMFVGLVETTSLVVGIFGIVLTVISILSAYVHFKATAHIRDDEKRARRAIRRARKDIQRQAGSASDSIADQVKDVELLRAKYSRAIQAVVEDAQCTGNVLGRIMDTMDVVVDGCDFTEDDRTRIRRTMSRSREDIEYISHAINLQSGDVGKKRSALFYFTRRGTTRDLANLRSIVSDPQEDPDLRELAELAITEIAKRDSAPQPGG